MTKNNYAENNDNRYSNDRSYDSLLQQYEFHKPSNDKFIGDIYLYIGVVIAILLIFYGIILMIKKCLHLCQKKEQNIQSSASLTRGSKIRRNSSVRNSLSPNRRSSLDIRFQMECRGRRLSQAHLISVITRQI
ncbi:unnamed protein product [Adineta steineri]|uniref:Uncharacterized protein n=1 Tax=Adineta steineri TaxID=433720 RepID=A0A814DCG4_9BILA|nr:unnamed protein product [Adineta steineri]